MDADATATTNAEARTADAVVAVDLVVGTKVVTERRERGPSGVESVARGRKVAMAVVGDVAGEVVVDVVSHNKAIS